VTNSATFLRTTFLVATGVVACSVNTGKADIMGFNNFTGWTYNTGDTGSPPQFITPDSIEFTTGPNNRRSLWYNTPQDITAFEVSFIYHASNIAASTNRQGITFAIQNAGLNALGGGGGGLGYSGISPSAAITIETDTGPGLTYSGYYTNGVLGGGSSPTTPVNAFDPADIHIMISYSGSVLSVNMTQGSNAAPTRSYFVGSLASVLGSSTALVGFTGGTFNTLGSGGGARQFLSDFSYRPVPASSSLAVMGLAGILAMRRRR
jgi:hypothetical protein